MNITQAMNCVWEIAFSLTGRGSICLACSLSSDKGVLFTGPAKDNRNLFLIAEKVRKSAHLPRGRQSYSHQYVFLTFTLATGLCGHCTRVLHEPKDGSGPHGAATTSGAGMVVVGAPLLGQKDSMYTNPSLWIETLQRR